jgi:hypothetical protein
MAPGVVVVVWPETLVLVLAPPEVVPVAEDAVEVVAACVVTVVEAAPPVDVTVAEDAVEVVAACVVLVAEVDVADAEWPKAPVTTAMTTATIRIRPSSPKPRIFFDLPVISTPPFSRSVRASPHDSKHVVRHGTPHPLYTLPGASAPRGGRRRLSCPRALHDRWAA